MNKRKVADIARFDQKQSGAREVIDEFIEFYTELREQGMTETETCSAMVAEVHKIMKLASGDAIRAREMALTEILVFFVARVARENTL